jgi:glycosidase
MVSCEQPVDHLQLEGLGSAHDLRELCQECEKVSMRVIADVVFNHMAVVARRSEWLRAQKDQRFMEELLQRLDHRFRPLDRTDFHPWKDMIVSRMACCIRASL